MKTIFLVLSALWAARLPAQNLQLHEDFRHTVDPGRNDRNYQSAYFEYFKTLDSGRAFIKPGSFLIKIQTDLSGRKANPGKHYLQLTQTFRCWRPKIFVNLQYSGGLGVTEPRQYSFYISNTFYAGAALPFQWLGGYWSAVLNYKYLASDRPSQDPMLTLYWWKALLKYKLELLGDFSLWTENRNQTRETREGGEGPGGKRVYFFAEPQAWFKISGATAAGVKINIYYHVNTLAPQWQVYPSLGFRVKMRG